MATTKFLGITMGWTGAAIEVATEVGLRQAEVERDIEQVRDSELTQETLLARCLDGADEDRAQGWREYVDAVVAAAETNEDEPKTIEELTGDAPDERITTEKFRIVCRGDGGPEAERYGVVGHQLPDGRFLTIGTAEGQRDDIWPSRDDYSPNGLDTIESITSEGVSSVDASVVGNADE